jgi:ERF superfamily protein
MSHSEAINELATALSKAQGEMQAAIKDKVNPFFKSSYADLGSIWDAARPVLSKHGLCVLQTTEMNADGSKIILVTTLVHSSGQWMKSFLPLNPAKNDSQGIGAAITYLRRYSLSAIVGVVCDDDDDGETAVGRGKNQEKQQPPVAQNQEKPQAPDEKIGKTEISVLTNLIQQLDEESKKSFMDWIQKDFKAAALQDIPKSRYEKCIIHLNNKIKYLNDKNKAAVA